MKQFNEQDHPRASDGKFTSKGGESSNPKDLQKDVEVKESSNKKMGQNDIESKAYEMLKGGAKEEDVVAWLEEQDPEADFYEMKDYVSQLAGNLEDEGAESPRGLQKDVEEPKISSFEQYEFDHDVLYSNEEAENTKGVGQKHYNEVTEAYNKAKETLNKPEYKKYVDDVRNIKSLKDVEKISKQVFSEWEKAGSSMDDFYMPLNESVEAVMDKQYADYYIKHKPLGKNEVKAAEGPKLDKKTQKVYDLYKTEIDKKTNELNTHYSDEAIEKAVKTFGRGNEFEERKIRSQYQREKENIENGIKRYQKEMEKLVSSNK